VPVPLPDLDLKTAEVTTQEKAEWEKELLGLSLSRQPFTAGRNDPGTTLCGEIDAEMDGQAITVIGEVATVSHLFTREHKAFVKATLDDISGSVEVTVWPKVFEMSRELWQEGSILLVEGKVRVRDERVQLNGDSVRRYQPKAAPVGEAVTTAPVATPIAAREAPAGMAPPKAQRLVVTINRSDDKDSDIVCLHKVIDTIKDFPGEDEVSLRLSSVDEVVNLRLTSAGYCAELRQRLVELVAEEGLRVEPATNTSVPI
ncbi:MAG: dnaE, partial [Dehalococcoidales bacterium]|nr:dnaE [Dehalococcoidales bacterium]